MPIGVGSEKPPTCSLSDRPFSSGGFPMTRRLLPALLALTLLLVAPARTIAQDASPVASPLAGPVVLSPDATVGGLTLGEWSARSWQWFFSFPEAVNPLGPTTGEPSRYGQSGPVFFLAG